MSTTSAAQNGVAATRRRATAKRRRKALPWARLSDEELLKLRFCDLKLTLERSPLRRQITRLYEELDQRGIHFHPHLWLSEEWFSPDGVPGIAVPFYLAHPRLERLERRIMRAAEGADSRACMRILRHEAGHAIDNAYRLRRKKRWREVFGYASLQYPAHYKARPGSRRYVHHLGEWYAQAHPTEDFAETFAVWLKPKSNWRKSYAEWPAFNKLNVVEELMTRVSGQRPPVRNRLRIEPLEYNTRTLAQYYRRKLAHNRKIRLGLADELVRRIFTTEPARKGSIRAATFLRSLKPALIDTIASDRAMERYSVQQILRLLIERCENLKLYVRGDRRDAVHHARWMLERLANIYTQGETPLLPL